MERLINSSRLIFALFLLLPLAILFSGCTEEDNFIDFRQLQENERALIQDFLDIHLAEWSAESIRVIDNRHQSGLILFEKHRGTGDSIGVGRQVSFRYTFHEITRDDNNVPVLILWGSNVNSVSPITYVTGNTDDIYVGLDEGIRHMRLGGKSRMIIPSAIGSGEFIPIVADIEITAMELD